MAENEAQPLDLSQFSDEDLRRYLNPTPLASSGVDLSQFSDAQLRSYLDAQKPLSNVKGEGLESSFKKGLGTSAILGLSDIPGAVGNAMEGGQYVASRAYGAMPGKTAEQGKALNEYGQAVHELGREKLPETIAKMYGSGNVGQAMIGHALSTISPMFAPTGEDIAAPILEKTGRYNPTDFWGQVGMTGGRTLFGSLAPLGWAGRSKALTEGATQAGALAQAAKTAAKGSPATFTIGALSDAATQATGDPLAGMITGAVAPIIPGKLIRGAQQYAAPIKAKKGSAEAQRQADIQFAEFPENPEAARANLGFQPKTNVEGAPFSTGEVSGDPGILQAQDVFSDTSRQFASDLKKQQGERNAAHVGAFQELAPENANQMAPTEVLTRRSNDIQAAHERNVRNLTEQARAEAENIPAGGTPEDIGQRLRDKIAESEAAADRATSEIYEPLNESGLAVVSAPVRDAANAIVSEVKGTRMAKQLSGEEADIFKKAGELTDVDKFSELHALEKRITNEVSRNNKSPEGNPDTVRRLGDLKTAIRKAFNDAADNQAAYEQSLVDKGQMRPEETLGARLQREADAFLAQKRGDVLPEPPPERPNMTQEHFDRLMAGKEAHATQKETYNEGPVGQILATLGFANRYKISASGIPKIAFSAGDKGYTNTQAFLRAANNDPAAIAALEDVAVMRLRERMGRSDTLAPNVLNTWRNQHANALRAIDEVSPGFSSRFDNAARATAALEDVQSSANRRISQGIQGPAQKFLGLTSADEVVPKVGNLLENGPTGINQVLDTAGRDPQVLNGLRSAGVDYMQRKFANAGIEGGESVMSSPKMTKFLRDNTDALTALYGAEGVNTMRRLAANFERAQEAISSQKTAGSPTFPKMKLAEQLRPESQKAPMGTDLVIWYEFLSNALKGEPVSAGLAAGVAGAKALFNTARQRGVNNINDLLHEGLLYPEVGEAMLQRGIDAKGRINQDAVRNLVKSLAVRQQVFTGSLAGQKQQEERFSRATGGAVNLMALSKAAKKHVTQSTEDLLNESDDTVTRALEIANQHI